MDLDKNQNNTNNVLSDDDCLSDIGADSDELELDTEDFGVDLNDEGFNFDVETAKQDNGEKLFAETAGFARGFPQWDLLPPERR